MKTLQYKILLPALILFLNAIVILGQQLPDSLIGYLEIAAKNNPVVLQKFNIRLLCKKCPRLVAWQILN
jgi:hypothetical protein